MEHDLSFVANFLVSHSLIITIISLLFITIGGYYIFRRELSTIKYRDKSMELEMIQKELEIIKIKKEIDSLK